MGLFDILRNKTKNKDLIHIKNLILVATADSVLEETELTIITHIITRMNVPLEYFQTALEELKNENKVRNINGRLTHTHNVLSDIEVITTDSFNDQLIYLQDYVLVMMSDGSIDDREKRLCCAIAEKMGLQPYSVDVVIKMIKDRTRGGSHVSAASSATGISIKARRLYNLVRAQVEFISDNFESLSRRGEGEAMILCGVMVARLNGDSEEEIQQDFLELLLSDLRQFIPGTGDEQIDFFNNRMAFYNGEINQFSRQTYASMAIYNTLYVHPFSDDPYNYTDVEPDVVTLISLYETIVEVANNIDQAIGRSSS